MHRGGSIYKIIQGYGQQNVKIPLEIFYFE